MLARVKKLVERFPIKLRVAMGVVLGCCTIYLAHYAAIVTKADVFFAEKFHTISDTIILFIYFLTFFFVAGKLSEFLGKLSGVLLCLAGGFSLHKAYLTFYEVVTTKSHEIEQIDVMFFVSITTIVLIAIQMVLVWDAHDVLHGHKHASLQAAKDELLADISQASAAFLEYLAIRFIPGTSILFRFIDLAVTIGFGWWMIFRGGKILFKKELNHSHDHHSHH
jgi:hypothetical protein